MVVTTIALKKRLPQNCNEVMCTIAAISVKLASGSRHNKVMRYCHKLNDNEEPYCPPLEANLLSTDHMSDASKKNKLPLPSSDADVSHTLSKMQPASKPMPNPMASFRVGALRFRSIPML